MMLRIALRFHRTGLIACAVIAGFNGLVQPLGFHAIAGVSQAARLQFGLQMTALARQLSYLLPLPVHPETAAGYTQWRALGLLPLIFGFWALIAGSGAIRGDEERGILELWLGAGASRVRLVAARWVGFVITAAAAVAASMALTGIGIALAGEAVGPLPLAEDGAALLAVTACCFSIALLVAQFTTSRRGAAGVAGGLLLTLFFVNSLGRTLDGIRPGRWISPFWYYDRTNAVAPGGSFDRWSTLGVAAAAVVITLLAAAAFARRDLGAALVRRTPRTGPAVLTPSRNPMLRTALSESLYEHRAGLFFWCLGFALLALFMTSLVKTLVDIVSSNPVLKLYLAGQHGDLERAAVSAFWFSTLTLLLAVYAITQVSRWAGEDGDGRLERTLSQPIARWRVVLERSGALLVSTALLVAVGSLATWIGTAAQGIALGGPGSVLKASLLLLPFGLAFGAVGAALTSAIPRAAVLVLSALAVASYFLDQLAPVFRWPSWVRDLSIFHLYGTPLTTGVYWTGLWALLAVVFLGMTIGVANMGRRDVGR